MSETSWSFPSGHALDTVVFWGWLAWRVNRPWFYGVAAGVTFMVSFSRVYLGVHYPVDVLAGAAIGLRIVVMYACVVKLDLGVLSRLSPLAELGLLAHYRISSFELTAHMLTCCEHYKHRWRVRDLMNSAIIPLSRSGASDITGCRQTQTRGD